MFEGEHFYNPLAQNKSIGQSFLDWFQGITAYSSVEYLEWFYGMTILGDPFLTINYDSTVLAPEISSVTHPNSYTWSSNNNPTFNWTKPVDVNGIVGYYYLIDKNPWTIPTAATGLYTSFEGTAITGLTDGIWYLHVVAKDGANNVGTLADHYRISVDISSPTVSILEPDNNDEFVYGNISISWQVTDAASGYSHSQIRINNSLITTVYSPVTDYVTNFIDEGIYYINITAYDDMGYSDSDQIQITFSIPPTSKFGISTSSIFVMSFIIIVLIKTLPRKKK
ncbi:MAG: Ig-like domain-containing protein [Candidatus Thorarchaeota archaeon]